MGKNSCPNKSIDSIYFAWNKLTYNWSAWWILGHDDDVMKWKHFPRYWPFVRRIHRSPVNSPHKGQWRGVLMFSVICVWINGWVNNRQAGDLRHYHAHYDVIVMAINVQGCKCIIKRGYGLFWCFIALSYGLTIRCTIYRLYSKGIS